MFKPKPTANQVALDETIALALADLQGRDASDEAIPALLDQLTKLHEIRYNTKDRVSKDTLVMVAANLVGIFTIVGYERLHVVTSKALPFIGKNH